MPRLVPGNMHTSKLILKDAHSVLTIIQFGPSAADDCVRYAPEFFSSFRAREREAKKEHGSAKKKELIRAFLILLPHTPLVE